MITTLRKAMPPSSTKDKVKSSNTIAKATANGTSQLETIARIVARTHEVRVESDTITLRVPSLPAAFAVRRATVTATGAGDETTDEAMATAGLRIASAAVAACVDQLDTDTAYKLVLATGGEFGELSRQALDLCGLRRVSEATVNEDDDDHPI